jgi:biotin operon repressor
MKNIKSDPKIIARRGMNNLSSKVMDKLYQNYPDAITLEELAKVLKLREKSIQLAIRNAIKDGVPIEMVMSNNEETSYRADPMEPLSWIIKEKASAETMLDLIGQLPLNGKSGTNNKKNINHRIYEEYVETLNELFDKWTSLKLIEQLKNGTKSE